MARPLRIQFPGAWYHVMHRGACKQAIFLDDSDRLCFLSLIADLVPIYGVEIHAYCLMDNHYHLIIHTPRGNLSEVMRHFNSRYTQIFNLRHSRDGALFRGRYKSILISAQDYLIHLSRYIHLNPIEAGIVNNPIAYQWSSYRYYLGAYNKPDWLTVTEIKNRFGNKNFIARYKKFVEILTDTNINEAYETASFPSVLGGKDFCEKIVEELLSESLSAEVVGKDRIFIPPKMNEILDFVATHFNTTPATLLHRQVYKVNFPPRNIAIFLCRKVGGMKLTEIGYHFGKLSYSSISNKIKKVESDRELRWIAVKMMSELRKKSKTLLEILQSKAEGKI